MAVPFFKPFRSLALALALTTALPAIAQAQSKLHELSPDKIAADVQKRINPDTQTLEYFARDFDPFEGEGSLAGTAALRSVSQGITISGQPVNSGAVLDLTAIYSSQSNDPYDVRGFDYAVFLSGEPVEAMRYDNQILECSTGSRRISYDDGYYTGSRYGYLAGIYRLFPTYRGHNHYRSHNYGYWRHYRHGYNHGFADARRVYGHRRYDYRYIDDRYTRFDNRHHDGSYAHYRYRDGHRYRDSDRNRDRRDGRDGERFENRTTSTIHPQVRGQDIRDRSVATHGRNPSSYRSQIFEDRLTNARRDARSSTPSAQTRPTTPSVRSMPAQERVRTVTSSRSIPTSRQDVSRRSEPKRLVQPSRPIKEYSRSTSTPQRVSRPVSPPKTVISRPRTPPKRTFSEPKRETRSSSSRSTTPKRSTYKAPSRPVKQSVPSRSSSNVKRRLNFYPVVGNFGSSQVYTSQNCVKEERLSLHIPIERLQAARYDGLSIILIDRQDQEVPVYLPPNYVAGYLQATGYGQSYGYNPYGQSQSQPGAYSGTYGTTR